MSLLAWLRYLDIVASCSRPRLLFSCERMGRIPDRWKDYTSFHQALDVGGARILAVKTPLCEVYNVPAAGQDMDHDSFLVESEWFTPRMLIEDTKAKLGVSISAVIDLTNTNRYYRPEHLPVHVHHFKLKCPGRETPSMHICQRFNGLLKHVFTLDPGGCVAVHCTHGVNRTGYLISQYLMKYHQLSPDEAVAAFVKTRGHQLDRTEYIAALHENRAKIMSDDTWPDPDEKPRQNAHSDRHSVHSQHPQPVARNHGSFPARPLQVTASRPSHLHTTREHQRDGRVHSHPQHDSSQWRSAQSDMAHRQRYSQASDRRHNGYDRHSPDGNGYAAAYDQRHPGPLRRQHLDRGYNRHSPVVHGHAGQAWRHSSPSRQLWHEDRRHGVHSESDSKYHGSSGRSESHNRDWRHRPAEVHHRPHHTRQSKPGYSHHAEQHKNWRE